MCDFIVLFENLMFHLDPPDPLKQSVRSAWCGRDYFSQYLSFPAVILCEAMLMGLLSHQLLSPKNPQIHFHAGKETKVTHFCKILLTSFWSVVSFETWVKEIDEG